MDADLSGRIAVVTGASGGLGREVALARAGSDLTLSARDRARLEETARIIFKLTGREALVIRADVTCIGAVEQMRELTEARFGTVSILVNAAGVFGPLAPLWESDPAEWIGTLMVNTVGSYLACRMFLPGMLAAGWGRIVNVSSAASLLPPGPLDCAYSTSKVALNRMTRHLAAELVGTGVSAMVIHPGSLKTDMWADIGTKVARAGDEGDRFRAWLDQVERTEGDPLSRAAELVLELVNPARPERNGEFCWPRESLPPQLASW